MRSDDELIGRLIANTKRAAKTRVLSITAIAQDIKDLVSLQGNLTRVSQTIGLSENMLNKFLSVEKLATEVTNLVENRKIDSVETVYSLAKYSPEIQIALAKQVVANKLSSQDIRALSPFIKQHQGKDVAQLLQQLLASKDKKISVLHFYLPKNFSANGFKSRVTSLLDEQNIVDFDVVEGIGTLKLTKTGERMLRQAAKAQKQSLQEFVETLMM